MNNLTDLQRQMLGTIPRHSPLHNNLDLTVYVIGANNPTDLVELSKAADKVLAFTPNPSHLEYVKSLALQHPKIEALESIVPRECIMLIVDAHLNNEQSDSELIILQAFKKTITRSNPFIFVRAEKESEANDLIKYLDVMLNYDSYYLLKLNDTLGIDQIWMVAIPRMLRLGDFGWEDASSMGHPKAERLVDVQIISN